MWLHNVCWKNCCACSPPSVPVSACGRSGGSAADGAPCFSCLSVLRPHSPPFHLRPCCQSTFCSCWPPLRPRTVGPRAGACPNRPTTALPPRRCAAQKWAALAWVSCHHHCRLRRSRSTPPQPPVPGCLLKPACLCLLLQCPPKATVSAASCQTRTWGLEVSAVVS